MRRRDFIAIAGAAAGWPFTARVQQKAMPVIGFLGNGGAPSPAVRGAFHKGLSETGYVEGQNLTTEYRRAEGRRDRLPALAADLVGRKVDVIVASGDPAAHAAKDATSTIPTVFIAGEDAVRRGQVASLVRPGGNLTGVSFLIVQKNPKRFQMMRELVPQAWVVALLLSTNNSAIKQIVRDAQDTARVEGVQLLILQVSSEGEIDAALAALVRQQAGALVVASDPFLATRL
jgi:putative tryptophan/tyrosine transport system substrate-binding protein